MSTQRPAGKSEKPAKPNPNSLDKLAELAAAAGNTRRPPVQEVRPVADAPVPRATPVATAPAVPPPQTMPPPAQATQQVAPAPDLQQLNCRIPADLHQALELATLQEKRRRGTRLTQREVVIEALQLWLDKFGG